LGPEPTDLADDMGLEIIIGASGSRDKCLVGGVGADLDKGFDRGLPDALQLLVGDRLVKLAAIGPEILLDRRDKRLVANRTGRLDRSLDHPIIGFPFKRCAQLRDGTLASDTTKPDDSKIPQCPSIR